MAAAIPERIVQAVSLLGLERGQRVLEVGGGRGVAAELICAAIAPGEYVGVDRSAAATSAARKRLRDTPGARLLTAELAALDFVKLGRFDLVFALNVNVFWTGEAREELEVLSALLPRGRPLWLAYDSPSGAPPPSSGRLHTVRQNFERAGYQAAVVRPRAHPPLVTAVRAVRPRR